MKLAPLENKEESNNFSSVRRINLVQSQNSGFSANIQHQIKRIEEKCDETPPKHIFRLF